MVYRNNTGRLGFWLHQCVLRNTLAGSKTVVSISRNPTVPRGLGTFSWVDVNGTVLFFLIWECLFSVNFSKRSKHFTNTTDTQISGTSSQGPRFCWVGTSIRTVSMCFFVSSRLGTLCLEFTLEAHFLFILCASWTRNTSPELTLMAQFSWVETTCTVSWC